MFSTLPLRDGNNCSIQALQHSEVMELQGWATGACRGARAAQASSAPRWGQPRWAVGGVASWEARQRDGCSRRPGWCLGQLWSRHGQRASGPSPEAGHPRKHSKAPSPCPQPSAAPVLRLPTGQVSSAAVTISGATTPSASFLGNHAALAAAVSHSFGNS